jgi:hypothetical protein
VPPITPRHVGPYRNVTERQIPVDLLERQFRLVRGDTQSGAALSVELAAAPGMDDDLLEAERARLFVAPERRRGGRPGAGRRVAGDEVRFGLLDRERDPSPRQPASSTSRNASVTLS